VWVESLSSFAGPIATIIMGNDGGKGDGRGCGHSLPNIITHVHNETARLLANNDTSPSVGVTPADWESHIGLWIVIFLVLIPCMLAACAQSVYSVKKRRRDRIERQLLAVSTNPTSRMLVLREIFKNDSRVSEVLIATISHATRGPSNDA
jgi:hypothetical protein